MENSEITDFQFPQPPTPKTEQKFIPNFTSSTAEPNNIQKNPKKRRTKLMNISHMASTSRNTSIGSVDGVAKLKSRKNPDPPAPKIAMPCSECGKTFWSWKALFGHMRCHPERQWRGINPPSNLITNYSHKHLPIITDEDHEIATCLLMLANGGENEQGHFGNCGFECSSCKKVFGSHQAIRGHRASHKNVKGCFANTGNDQDIDYEFEEGEVRRECLDEKIGMGHKCSICFRVFSSGQALGGHKRCHWEKGEDSSSSLPIIPIALDVCDLDLNIPASISHQNSTSGLSLDLRLGI